MENVTKVVKQLVPRRVKNLLRRNLGKTTDTWSTLIAHHADEWQAARQAAESGQRVLMALSMGGYPAGAVLESTLAVALTLRGAKVDVLLCDSFLPACQLTEMDAISPQELAALNTTQPRCATCQLKGERTFEPLGLPIYWYSQLVTSSQRQQAREIAFSLPLAEIEHYKLDGLAVGEHAMAGALRYFGRGDLENEPQREGVLRRYLESALLTVYTTQTLIRKNQYDVACFHHGIYVPQGLIGEVCRKEGLRVVNWNPAYRKPCFIFSHNDSYHHTMVTEPVSEWENIDLTPELEKKTLDYLDSRRSGTQDWIWFHENPQEEVEQIVKETGIDFSKPCIGLLTSVMWDAKLHYVSNAFPSMVDCVIKTIEYFATRPELQLIIRVHPAEIRGSVPSRQPIAAEIQRAFPNLPPNIFVIPPESQISTYAIAERCNAVLIYNTKTGIEVSSMGVPVIVAGEAWIRNKGFSLDATSPDEYIKLLDRLPLPEKLSQQDLIRARKYATHFFFRRMIPVSFISWKEGFKFNIDITNLNQLRPGNFTGLDVICDGILNGTAFTYPIEKL